ncbi:SDR family NAD(P)-dependent oxidoreductase [Thermotalea metallivorans]|uniref:3-oxoacyl-[acyl-carrier-protein] reductase FabG n=1 Tax=Thermotalea metallivorans TaxID=520762 RepID=A0A140L4I0_9FIRM|nr:SDR family oxidoreductase [Thermotalea metallivorans]KXG75455.1 3-oxoacyl-[acyl-carrier-protein] reductase FabG [Thermotalea metallivorans]
MKRVIVTGDSGGLGHKIVTNLLNHEEYSVIGVSRQETATIMDLRQEYKERYQHIAFDLSRPERIKDLFSNRIKDIGPIYGLVNNAAYAYDDIVTNARIESLERMYNINVFSPILLTKYVIRNMLLYGTKGAIVHISSVSAHTGYKGLSMYASTKGALEAFSIGVAREWGGYGIRSNCVAPGFMETPMSESLTPEQKRRIYKRTSLKEETSADSVAKTVAFLLSENASSITGTVIRVDNGTI